MKMSVEKAMTRGLITINWDKPISHASELMKTAKVRHLPVIDDEGELLGILSDRDVARAMKATISLDDAGQGIYSESDEFDPDAKVRHYMSWPVKTADKHCDLRMVAGIMVSEKISAVLITDNGDSVGIVTTEDLLKVLMGLLEHPEFRIGIDLEKLMSGNFSALRMRPKTA